MHVCLFQISSYIYNTCLFAEINWMKMLLSLFNQIRSISTIFFGHVSGIKNSNFALGYVWIMLMKWVLTSYFATHHCQFVSIEQNKKLDLDFFLLTKLDNKFIYKILFIYFLHFHHSQIISQKNQLWKSYKHKTIQLFIHPNSSHIWCVH